MTKTANGGQDRPRHRSGEYTNTINDLMERVRELEAENLALRVQMLSGEDDVLRAERSRVAEQLHDGVAQTLALVMLKMEIITRLIDQSPTAAKAEMERAISLMETCVNELRSAVYSLRSPDVERLGFRRALERLVEGMREQMSLDVALEVPGVLPVPLPSQLQLFQILQERLDQIAKAGASTSLSIEIAVEGHSAVARLTEVGFQLTKGREAVPPESWIRKQQERIASLGGTIRLLDQPPGSVLEVTLNVQ